MTATLDPQTCPDAKGTASPKESSRPGTQLADDHHAAVPQRDIVVGNPSSPAANHEPSPIPRAPQGTPSTHQGHSVRVAQPLVALVGLNFPDGHTTGDTQSGIAVGDSSSTGPGHRSREAHTTCARPGGFLRDPVLGMLADVLDDFETVRIANANRVRQLTRTEVDSDGENRGFGLDEDALVVRKLLGTVAALEQAEHEAVLNLQRTMRAHPLAGYQKRHRGIGEKQLARLLAAIGDPYWHDVHDRPRTVSELWAYCGYHVVHSSGRGQRVSGDHSHRAPAGTAPKRQRGQLSNWSETARKRVYVIAAAMPKFPGGYYEQVYRDARVKYADAVHPVDCVRCGPSGKPALAGSDLSDGHKHMRAVRIVAKEILRDLWIESRDIYNEGIES